MLEVNGNFASLTLLRLGLAIGVVGAPFSAGAVDLSAPVSDPRSSVDYSNGIPAWGGWIIYPSLVVGGVYDDNVFRSSTAKRAEWGTRIIPSFTAEIDDGIHQTIISGLMDARIYPDLSGANTIDANVGIRHRYEVTRETVVRLSGNYVRQADVFSSGNTPSGDPIAVDNQVNVFTGEVAVDQQLGKAFLTLGTSIVHTKYEYAPERVRDGTIYGTAGRLGFWLTPQINAFVEAGYDWRRYESIVFDSQGYRAVGGLAFNQPGLLQGEVFGGYQAQDYETAAIGKNSGSVYGAKVAYFPTQYWTVRGYVDRSLSVSTLPTPQSPIGTAMTATSVGLSTDWTLWRDWTVTARVGYNHAEYVNTSRKDDAWNAGARLTYQLWTNLGITFDYAYTNLESSEPGSGYVRNMYTLGANYRY